MGLIDIGFTALEGLLRFSSQRFLSRVSQGKQNLSILALFFLSASNNLFLGFLNNGLVAHKWVCGGCLSLTYNEALIRDGDMFALGQ